MNAPGQCIQLTGAGIRYPSASSWAFRHLDVALEFGETVRVVGRNGAGKSTLLRALCGLEPLTEGTRSVRAGTIAAYMNQSAASMLAQDLTIREQFMAVSVGQRDEILSANTLERFDLDLHHRADAFVGHLSGGERQIVALLCTLAAGANVLCLDEFTVALDRTSLRIATSIIAQVQRESRIALVVVSHDDNITIAPDRSVELLRGNSVE